jgi:predicted permease
MHTVLQDLRYALRLAVRRPTLTGVAILTLGIGIGGTTATFSIVNAVLLRPLPVNEPERVVRVFGATETRAFDVLSYPNAADLAARATTFSSLAIHQQAFVASGVGDAVETAAIELVSGNYFTTLQVAPAYGRAITEQDDRLDAGERVAVISDKWWRTRFGGVSTAVGSDVVLNSARFTVVGIAPPFFRGSYDALGTDIWVPLMTYNIVRPRALTITSRGWGWLSATGRLRSGVSAADAQSELDGLAAGLATSYSVTNKDFKVRVVPALALPEELAPALNRVLTFALVVVGLALLAACANIANTQLATVISRQREIAVRLALGAARGRVMRQWFTESTLLVVVASGVGLLIAVWARDGFVLLRPPIADLQNLDPNLSLDARVLAFTAAVAGVVAILFGVLPAARAAQVDITGPLKEDGVTATGSRRRSWAQSLLVVAQVAVSLALLIASGLLVRSLSAASSFDLGFDAEHLTVAHADASGLRYEDARTRAYVRGTLERVRALPGVRDATIAVIVPLSDQQESRGVIIDGYTPPSGRLFVSVATNVVGSNYFEMMKIPIVRGRAFTVNDGDDTAAPVAIVNETMARRYWTDGNPIGRRLRLGRDEPSLEVVGIAKDSIYYALGEEPRPYFYVPFGAIAPANVSFHVRTDAPVDGLPQALRRELRASDPRIRVPIAMSFDELRQVQLYPSRAMASISGTFGILALVLTIVGLYGVVMYAVSQRTREFAVRVALGAGPADLIRGVLTRSLGMVLAGVAAGTCVAIALVRLMRGFLFGVSPFDPVTFVGWTAVLVLTSLAAAYIPARRATKIDPAAALTGRQ